MTGKPAGARPNREGKRDRPQRILEILAGHPEGLSTPEIRAAVAPGHASQQADTICLIALYRLERYGLVQRAGRKRHGTSRHAVVWKLATACIREPEVTHQREGQMDGRRLIWALVAELPPEGSRFTREQREAWVNAAEAVIQLAWGDGTSAGSWQERAS